MPAKKLLYKNFSWTPELAYAVGLLATDGNLSKDERHIVFRSSDLQLLEVFEECFNLNGKIRETHNDPFAKRQAYRIQFSNVQLYRWLVTIGLTPAKTYTIGEIQVPDKFFRDFFRGCFDGDGTIFTYKDIYNVHKWNRSAYIYWRFYISFISASEKHIRWLQSKIIALAAIKPSIHHRPPRSIKHVPVWQLRFAKKNSIKLMRWMYYKDGLPCLERKRQRALSILGAVEQNPKSLKFNPFTTITSEQTISI